MSEQYILDGHIPVKSPLEEWGQWMESVREKRVVAKTKINNKVEVSTVFLGLNHNFSDAGPPLLFETMIFGGPHDEYQQRYETWEQAEAGHKVAVKLASE